jgi:beta-galactosidase
MNATVYINGHELGTHPYGYTSFFHDLTPYLKSGANNVLAVRVDQSKQRTHDGTPAPASIDTYG